MKLATKLLVLVGLLTLARNAIAQNQSASQGSENIVTRYVVELVSGGGQAFQNIGEYATLDEANLRYKQWTDAHPDDLRLARIRPVRYRVSPPTANRPQPSPLPISKPAARPGQTMAQSVALPGTTWIGSETLQGYGRLEFRFIDSTRVKMVDAQSEIMGTYYRNGNTITLNFYNGNCYYVGTINGNQISGRGTAGKTGFTWSISR